VSGSDLAAQLGVGIGYKVSDRVSLRTGVDFRNIFTEGTSLQEFRVQAGLGLDFGQLEGGSSPEPRSGAPSGSRAPDRSGQDRYGSEVPRYELSAGYAFLRDEDVNVPLGWSTSFAFNFTNSLGAVADIGGNYKTIEGVDVGVHAFLVGSRYSFRGERVTPYLEGLIGVARFTASVANVSESDFAVQFGVGIGYKVSDRVSLRTGVDFRNVSSEGGSTQQYRVLAGVSFGFGGSREAAPADSSQGYEPLPPLAPPTVAAPAPAAPPTAQPVRPAPQPQAPLTRPPAPAPAPAPPPAAAPAPASLGKARELLSAGSYPQAADAFRADLPIHAPNMFTIPVGVYCDASNLAQLVRSADARELVLVRLMLRGQTCYGLYWGLFASGSEAQAALAKIPPSLRATGQAPISVSRVLARAR
jgi:opacity protein-like surface antigen